MTFPKYRNIEGLIIKSNKILSRNFFPLFYLNLGKCAFFKIAFRPQINVEFVRLDFISRGKFILGFLESV